MTLLSRSPKPGVAVIRWHRMMLNIIIEHVSSQIAPTSKFSPDDRSKIGDDVRTLRSRELEFLLRWCAASFYMMGWLCVFSRINLPPLYLRLWSLHSATSSRVTLCYTSRSYNIMQPIFSNLVLLKPYFSPNLSANGTSASKLLPNKYALA